MRQRLDHLKYPALKGRLYSDTSFSQVKSTRGNSAAQHFTNGLGYDILYPIKSESRAAEALMPFIHDAVIPQTLVTDNSNAETDGEWGKTVKVHHIQQQFVVPHSPWQNLAESSVRHLKQGIRRATRLRQYPKRIWDYYVQWVSAIRRLTELDIAQLDGRVPEEFVIGTTPDISVYALFDWYQYVYYWNPIYAFPHEKKCLGRWIGVAEVSTDIMACFILKDTGNLQYVSLYGAFQIKINNLTQPKLQ